MKGRWRVRVFGAVLALGLVAAGIVGGGRFLRTDVTVAPVEEGAAVNAVAGVVRVSAERTAEIRAEAGGRVIRSELELGRFFEEGEVLLVLDGSDLERRLGQLRRELEAEEAVAEIGPLRRYDLEQAREELAQKEMQVEKGQVSRRDLENQRRLIARLSDEIELEKIQGRRRVDGLRNEIANLEAELAEMELRAPVAGQIVEVFAHPGDLVGPRSAVARLLSGERIVEATVSEEDFAGVAEGQAATVRFLGYGSRLFQGRVARVLPAADERTQRYTVYLDLEIARELLVPGITGEASIVLDEREGGLIVPRRALMGDRVFVVEDGRASLRKVQPGFISLNKVEILSGVNAGEPVVVENVGELRDGDRVLVKKNVP